MSLQRSSTPTEFSADPRRAARGEAAPAYLSEWQAAIEAGLDLALPAASAHASAHASAPLVEAMRYAVFPGGKRVRPILCVAAAEACGGSLELVLPTACALELVHAFSLIHDDLPALDDDALRRGRPACHVRFGEATAILAGDALLARAFELLADQGELCPPARALRALKIVAASLGADGMAGGQLADLRAEGTDAGGALVEFIHARKTGAFIAASTAAGAVLAGADEGSVAALRAYGEGVGLAFQIQDDLLGAAGDEAKTGKPVGRDDERKKATYPRAFGVDAAKRAAEAKVVDALCALDRFGQRADPLRAIAHSVLRRDR